MLNLLSTESMSVDFLVPHSPKIPIVNFGKEFIIMFTIASRYLSKFSDDGPISISVKKDTLNSNYNVNKSDVMATKNGSNKYQANGVIVSIKDRGKGIDRISYQRYSTNL